MADAPAAPALPDTNTPPETMDGTEPAGSETMDTAEADTDVAESTASAAGDLAVVLFLYWPNMVVKGPGNVGILFDDDGTALVTEEKVQWLAEQIAAGNLPEPPPRALPIDTAERVAMRRDAPLHAGGPTQADVHPDEVQNWQAAGWVIDA